MVPVEKVRLISEEEFKKSYLKKSIPLHIEKGVNEWKALSLWSPDYLSNILSDEEIRLAVSDSNVVSYDNSKGSNLKFEKIKVKEAIHKIVNNKLQEKKYYIIHYPLNELSHPLIQDIDIPKWADKTKKYKINLWCGEADNITPLHFDGPHGFLAQVFGRKRVKLYPPKDSPYLYPTYHRDPPNHSIIPDIDNPDYELFPDFRKAKAFECLLNPGDVLFIPSGWWHQVYSLDLSISINFWWGPKLDECPLIHISRYVVFDFYKKGKMKDLENFIDFSPFKNYLEVASYIASKNYRWLSILFSIDFFETSLRDYFSTKKIKQAENFLSLEKSLDFIAHYFNCEKQNLQKWVELFKVAMKEDDDLISSDEVLGIIEGISSFIDHKLANNTKKFI